MEKRQASHDPKSGVQIGFVTGGVSDRKRASRRVLSLGDRLQSAILVSILRISSLIDYRTKGKRIAVGPVGAPRGTQPNKSWQKRHKFSRTRLYCLCRRGCREGAE